MIRPDGNATLIESQARTWHYRWSIVLMWLGLVLAAGAFVPVIVLNTDDFWGAMQVLAGLVAFVVGMALHPHGKAPRGERWTSIGGATE